MIGVYEIIVPLYANELTKTRMVVAFCRDVEGAWAYVDAIVPDHAFFILMCESYIKDYLMKYINKRLPNAIIHALKEEKPNEKK